MSFKLLTEHHLGFLSLKGGYTCSSEYIRVRMQHCWKSHVMAQMVLLIKVGSSIWPGHYINQTFLISLISEKLTGSNVGEEYEVPELREPPPPLPSK